MTIDPRPVSVAVNPCPAYSLVNSIDFHPNENLFCVTYTHGNRVTLYRLDPTGKLEMVQSLNNPSAHLSEPQHAVFSPDGSKMVVANWTNQTLTVYGCGQDGLFSAAPVSIISPPPSLARHKPHGMAFSPCGRLLTIAYGAAKVHGRAVALFRVGNEGLSYELVSTLEALPGTPKGIAFSPDGKCLLVTFSDENSLVVFDVDPTSDTIVPIPRQVIQGSETQISRPEDVKISPRGDLCALSNSDQHTVTFYFWDSVANRIAQAVPVDILRGAFYFPHGLAFSSDGNFLAVTEFGAVRIAEDGNITWGADMPAVCAKVDVYRMRNSHIDSKLNLELVN